MLILNRLSYARETNPHMYMLYAGERDHQGVPPPTAHGRVQHGGVGLPEAEGQSDVGDGAPQVRREALSYSVRTYIRETTLTIFFIFLLWATDSNWYF